MKRRYWIGASSLVTIFVVACSSSSNRATFESTVDPNQPDGSDQGFGSTKGPCAVNGTQTSDQDKDYDGDGYPLRFDCNECDPGANAGAFDVPGNGIDEDCNGTPDDTVVECDDDLSISGSKAMDAAKALGLCKKAGEDSQEWGVISARYIRPDGTGASASTDVGLLDSFGVNDPRAGKALLALSSGYGRAPGQTGYQTGNKDKGVMHGAPDGYPKEFAGCPASIKTGPPQDGIGLELKIRVPSNAKSFAYQQNFFTHEYPVYVCTRYNDFLVTIMDPKPEELPDGNIAFDSAGNPISVNNGLLQVCSPGTYVGKKFDCPLGTESLQGTGFEGSAATGWLTTTAPVVPGSVITLQFSIWDSGDGILDSTVLIDDFQFSASPANGAATVPTPR